MSNQPALFDAPEQRKPRRLVELPPAPAARVRRSDPESSHVAADQIEASGALARQQRETLVAVYRWPSRTSKALATESGLDYHAIARRLPELRDQGYVVSAQRPGGCKWRVTDAGRPVAAMLFGRWG